MSIIFKHQKIYFFLFFLINFFSCQQGLIPLPKEIQNNVFIYLNFIKNGYLSYSETLTKYEKPKVSIVIPMYNEEDNVMSIIRSIQNQKLREIEIVAVNDKSKDKTLSILKNLQKEDPRIVIINNKKNRGVMYNRIYGALQSKGEFVAFVDADDAYCNPEILNMAYKAGKENNLDLVHFHTVGGTYDKGKFGDLLLFAVYNPHIFNQIIKQPILGDNYFGNSNNITGSGLVFDKLYSRKEIIKMADYLGEDIWNQNLVYMDDALFTFAAMKTADSFMLIDQIGYWHWLGNDVSTTSNVFEYKGYKLINQEKADKKLGDYMIALQKILDLTENEPQSIEVREHYLKGLGEDKYLHGFARSIQYDRYLSLIERFINWKYMNKDTKKRMIDYVKYILSYSFDIKLKYNYLFKEDNENNNDNNDDDDQIDDL